MDNIKNNIWIQLKKNDRQIMEFNKLTMDEYFEQLQEYLYGNEISIKINRECFSSVDAEKIFMNIYLSSLLVLNSFTKNNLEINEENNYKVINYIQINGDVNLIELISLMIDKANQISDVVTRDSLEIVSDGVKLRNYKRLIEGVKNTYQKSLLLIKVLFSDNLEDNILSKYYQLIHSNDDVSIKEQLLYNLLMVSSESNSYKKRIK